MVQSMVVTMVVEMVVEMVDRSVLVFHNNISKLPIIAEKDLDETSLLVFAS